jgi:hypothetical protein
VIPIAASAAAGGLLVAVAVLAVLALRRRRARRMLIEPRTSDGLVVVRQPNPLYWDGAAENGSYLGRVDDAHAQYAALQHIGATSSSTDADADADEGGPVYAQAGSGSAGSAAGGAGASYSNVFVGAEGAGGPRYANVSDAQAHGGGVGPWTMYLNPLYSGPSTGVGALGAGSGNSNDGRRAGEASSNPFLAVSHNRTA